MIIDSILDNGLSRVIGKPTTFTRISFKLHLFRTVLVLCMGLALMMGTICIPESWAGTERTCCCSDKETITFSCRPDWDDDKCCTTVCVAEEHGGFLYVGPCKGEKSTETNEGETNRCYDNSFNTGDPITTNSGAYFFDMSLLNPGGPMGLGFTFIYRSDEDNTMTRNPNELHRYVHISSFV